MKLYKTENKRDGDPDYYFQCPGCKCDHGIWVTPYYNGNGATWSFNGDVNKPTFSPSIKVTCPTPKRMLICHSFVKDGKIEYLSDCTHELAGQTIELPEYDKEN